MNENHGRDSVKKNTPALDAAKKQANRLMTRLKALGQTIQHTHALEGVAAVQGFPDWNTFSASLPHQPKRKEENTILLMGVGSSKTTVMCVLMGEVLQQRPQSGTLVYIDCGDGEVFKYLPKYITDFSHVTDVLIEDGQWVQKNPPPKDARCVIVNLHADPLGKVVPFRMEGPDGAFCFIAKQIQSKWPKAITRNIHSIIIDQFHQVRCKAHVLSSLTSLASMGEIVIGTAHAFPEWSTALSPCHVIFDKDSVYNFELPRWDCRVTVIAPKPNQFFSLDDPRSFIEDVACANQLYSKKRFYSMDHVGKTRRWMFEAVVEHCRSVPKPV